MAKFDSIAKTAGGLGKAIFATAASEAADAALKEVGSMAGQKLSRALDEQFTDPATGETGRSIPSRVTDFYKNVGRVAEREILPHLSQPTRAVDIEKYKEQNWSRAKGNLGNVPASRAQAGEHGDPYGEAFFRKGKTRIESAWDGDTPKGWPSNVPPGTRFYKEELQRGVDPMAGAEERMIPSNFAQKLGIRDPEAAANGVGWVATGGALAATALGAQWLAGGGWKPKSDYAAPVDPNPNVTAANVSYQNQYQLEEQKFRHHMALQSAREQARIPGPQNTSAGSYGGGPYGAGDLRGMAQGIANQKYKFG